MEGMDGAPGKNRTCNGGSANHCYIHLTTGALRQAQGKLLNFSRRIFYHTRWGLGGFEGDFFLEPLGGFVNPSGGWLVFDEVFGDDRFDFRSIAFAKKEN